MGTQSCDFSNKKIKVNTYTDLYLHFIKLSENIWTHLFLTIESLSNHLGWWMTLYIIDLKIELLHDDGKFISYLTLREAYLSNCKRNTQRQLVA